MKSHFLKIQFILLVSLLMCACSDDNEEGKKINMEFKRNNQLYKTFIILYIRVLLLRVRFSLIS